jgi:hypothetical protein
MADTKNDKPRKGTQKETPVTASNPEGVTFKDLIQFATGSEAPTETEFESAMAAKGYRSGDVRKLKRAFRRVNSSESDYFLRDKGFDVFDKGQQVTGSGKAKGNKAGADLGDLLGLGNDVSLLAGALRNEKSGYDKSQASKQQAETDRQQSNVNNQKLDGSTEQSLSPETEFARTMKDLLAVTAAGNGAGTPAAGEGKKSGTGGKGKQKPAQPGQSANERGQGFVPDENLLNWSPLDVMNPAFKSSGKSETPKDNEPQAAAQTQQDTRTKGEKGRDLLVGNRSTPKGFFDFDSEEFGQEAYGLGESAVDLGTGAGYLAPWLAPFKKAGPLGYAINKVAAPFALTGVAMKGIGDAVNPNEDVNWGELGMDAANIGAMALLNKMAYKNFKGPQPAQLPGGSPMAPSARPRTKFSFNASQRANQAAGKFAQQFNNIAWPAMETQPAGLLGRYTPKLGGPTGSPAGLNSAAIEENFLMNLTEDLNHLPIKRRGGVLTKFRGCNCS